MNDELIFLWMLSSRMISKENITATTAYKLNSINLHNQSSVFQENS